MSELAVVLECPHHHPASESKQCSAALGALSELMVSLYETMCPDFVIFLLQQLEAQE